LIGVEYSANLLVVSACIIVILLILNRIQKGEFTINSRLSGSSPKDTTASARFYNRVIYHYDFIHANKNEDPAQKIVEKVSTRLKELKIRHVMSLSRVVRSVGPYW